MSTFVERWRQLNWDEIRLRINSKKPADVERALHARHPTREDMMALLSPAASAYLEPMAQRAQQLTRQRFGNTANLLAFAVFLVAVGEGGKQGDGEY